MNNSLALVMFMGSIAALGAMAYAYRYKHEQGGVSLILAACAVALGSFAHAMAIIAEAALTPGLLAYLSDAALLAPWLMLMYVLCRTHIVKRVPFWIPAAAAIVFAAITCAGAFMHEPSLTIYLALITAAQCLCAALLLIYAAKSERHLTASAIAAAALLALSAAACWLYYRGMLPANFSNITLPAALYVLVNRFARNMLDTMPGLSKTVVENMADAVIVLNRKNAVIEANPAALRLLGSDVSHRITPAALALRGWPDVSVNTQKENNEAFTLEQDGAERHFDLHRTPVFDPSGAFLGQILVAQEITDLRRAEQLLEHVSTHDGLTGLPNRRIFQERLQKELDLNERLGQYIAVIQINIDNLQAVNDTMSIYAGDELILSLARRLEAKLRKVDSLTRFSGDEFLIIMPQIRSPELHVSGLVKRLFETVSESFDISGRSVRVTFSMGITIAPSDGATVEALLSNANMALAFSKASGKNRYSFYDSKMSQHARERWRLAHDLRAAIEGDQFSLMFQPQIRVTDSGAAGGAVAGVEALLRWEHPERGLVSPEVFIPVAEEFNLIGEIGAWVLRASIRQLAVFIRMGYTDLKMCINVSVKQLYDPGLAPTVEWLLSDFGVPAANVELEITESIALSENPILLGNITRVRALGVHFVMDDFGMGHSSLVYLRNFPLNKLKLDKSLSIGALEDNRTGAVVHSIAVLCYNLEIDMVVEFVESREHLERLIELGCNVFQGYLFSKPLSAEELPALLERYKPSGAAGGISVGV